MFRKIKALVRLIIMPLVWYSPYGRAILLQTWKEYYTSILFKEREKHFGKMEAARMINWSEWDHFKNKVIRNSRFMLSIFPWPYFVLSELEEEEGYLYRVACGESLLEKDN